MPPELSQGGGAEVAPQVAEVAEAPAAPKPSRVRDPEALRLAAERQAVKRALRAAEGAKSLPELWEQLDVLKANGGKKPKGAAAKAQLAEQQQQQPQAAPAQVPAPNGYPTPEAIAAALPHACAAWSSVADACKDVPLLGETLNAKRSVVVPQLDAQGQLIGSRTIEVDTVGFLGSGWAPLLASLGNAQPTPGQSAIICTAIVFGPVALQGAVLGGRLLYAKVTGG